MQRYTLHHPTGTLEGEIYLDGSKSISNRVLIIRALCHSPFEIIGLSSSDDTRTMLSLLESDTPVLDAHHAGTTFRFLTALLAVKGFNQILTGSDRMKQRPVGGLVDALRQLGFGVLYTEKEGYPPLQFTGRVHDTAQPHFIHLDAGTSSQFITALMLIAPVLERGLVLVLNGELVSRPYLEMTRRIMAYFGVECSWKENTITIPSQPYQASRFHVEADWSAASYYYCMAALSKSADIKLYGLFRDSLQGDAAIHQIGASLGIRTETIDGGVRIIKESGRQPASFFEYDFLPTPDLAQGVAVTLAGLGCPGLLSGLQTLRIKETDRIFALQTELAKAGVYLSAVPQRFASRQTAEFYMLEGKAVADVIPCFDSYSDHRMAMSFACLGTLFPVQIADPGVVSKSYPRFWEDLEKLGFVVEEGNSY